MLKSGSGTTSATSKVVFVLAILGAMVSVPYLFPAPLSISRSYVVGFSNRAAILLLFVGTALLAAYTRGRLGRTATKDSTLGWVSLLIALVCTLLFCLPMCGGKSPVLPGPEAEYISNRAQLLAAGLVPYKQFEFVYGPLLLYPILWTEKFFNITLVSAFDVVWLTFWELGVAAIWVIVREIDLPVPSRRAVFVFLVVIQLVFAPYGSLSYSPLRAYLCTFCIVVSCYLWRRFQKPWLLVISTLVSLGLTICCSMDQAVGVTCGLFAYLFFLAWTSRKNLPWSAVLFAFAGAIACFALAEHFRLTEPIHSFGGGGYAYPLLPSLGIFAALFAYIVAGCTLYQFLYFKFIVAKQERSANYIERGSLVLPLVVAGCSMIPNALGRCDILHITAAIPAFVIGVAVICSMPAVRMWWSMIAVVGLVFLPYCADRIVDYTSTRLRISRVIGYDPALTAQGFTEHLSDNQWYVSPSALKESQLPCDRQYFSPSYMPVPTSAFLPQCLDTGYYLGVTDVITPKAIEYKVEELRQHAGQPLLMENTPLEAQLPLQLAFTDSLFRESATFWVPKGRHAPLTYAPIICYIRKHYVAGPIVADGLLQIWYPAEEPGHAADSKVSESPDR